MFYDKCLREDGVKAAVSQRHPRIFYGWIVVLGVALIFFYGAGTFFYGFGTFFNPIRNDFRWSAAATAMAFTLFRLEGGIAAPVVGLLVDRYGPRRLMLFGLIVMGIGFILLSRINSLWTFYAAFIVLSIGFSAGVGVVGMTAVANWFVKKRGQALGIMFMGAGLAGFLAPVLRLMIEQLTWRTTLVYVGLGTWLICLPAALLIRHRPEQYGYLPDGLDPATVDEETRRELEQARAEGYQEGLRRNMGGEVDIPWRQAIGTHAFWLLALAASLSNLAITTLVVHAIPHLENVGISPRTAPFIITLITLSSIVGRGSFGWLGDRWDKRYLMAFCFALQSIGVMLFAFVNAAWMIIPFVVLFGPSYGGAIPLRPALMADLFGRRSFGAVQGLMQGVMTLISLGGPVFAGWVFDVSGTYRPAFLALALLLLPAVPIILSLKRPIPSTLQTPVPTILP